MSVHTQGRLKARAWNSHAETTIVRETSAPVEGIAECGGFGRASADCEIDARRLAACWNACVPISTKTLEEFEFDDIESSTLEAMQRAEDERDQLIEELRKVRSMDWGTLQACIVEGSGERATGIARAKTITSMNVRLDELLAKYPVPA